MPWILSEDAAIKALLESVTLPGSTAPVQVRFASPEPETPALDYPQITIDRISANRAPHREHRGTVRLDYPPEGQQAPQEGDRWGWYAEFPIPFDIDYSVVVRTRRQSDQVALVAILATEDYLPERGGALELADRGVLVSMDLVGGPDFADTYDEDGKRLFETHYMVRVASELTPWEIERLTYPDHIAGRIWTREETYVLSTWDETT